MLRKPLNSQILALNSPKMFYTCDSFRLNRFKQTYSVKQSKQLDKLIQLLMIVLGSVAFVVFSVLAYNVNG